jgi:hypothetical protein
MPNMDTFLVALYSIVDNFCKLWLQRRTMRGPEPSIAISEIITLAVFAQWQRFGSERGFYRFAQANLRPFFPNLPERSRLNRLMRTHR